jgi:ferric-dicitrate binding protein FerR (iron transport regulator)
MTLEERAAYEQWVADETHRLAMADMHRVWALLETDHRPVPRASALAGRSGDSVRRIMVGAMCAISLGLVALSCVHVPFWTSLDWVTR